MYTTVQRSEQHERAGSRSFLYQAVARILVLARRLRTGLVFDGLAAVRGTPPNRDDRLALLAQPVRLGPRRLHSNHRRRSSNEIEERAGRLLTESSAVLEFEVNQPSPRARAKMPRFDNRLTP
jgi:hypothetical protein